MIQISMFLNFFIVTTPLKEMHSFFYQTISNWVLFLYVVHLSNLRSIKWMQEFYLSNKSKGNVFKQRMSDVAFLLGRQQGWLCPSGSGGLGPPSPFSSSQRSIIFLAVLGIWIFLGLPDPDPLGGQRCGSGSGSFPFLIKVLRGLK